MAVMNLIEARIIELTKWILAVGAYCCRLDSVKDMTEKPMTVLVSLCCPHHGTYSFEVPYGDERKNCVEKDDSILRRLIASEIVEHMQAPIIVPANEESTDFIILADDDTDSTPHD